MCPTPPVPAWIKTFSPFVIFPLSIRAFQAVIATRGKTAASAIEREAGLRASKRASAKAYSASTPGIPLKPPMQPKTSSPTLKSITPSPTSVTTPATSPCRIPGNSGPISASKPLRILQSTGLIPDAETFKITCIGRIFGLGMSLYLNESAEPCKSRMMAFIRNYENRS